MFGLTSASYRRPGMREGRGEQISEWSSCSSGRSWSPSAESATSSAVSDLKSRRSLGKTEEWIQSRWYTCILLSWQWSKQVCNLDEIYTYFSHDWYCDGSEQSVRFYSGLPTLLEVNELQKQNPLTVGIPQVNPFSNVQVRLLSRHSRQCQEANHLSV